MHCSTLLLPTVKSEEIPHVGYRKVNYHDTCKIVYIGLEVPDMSFKSNRNAGLDILNMFCLIYYLFINGLYSNNAISKIH